ncbi:hypothetical protein RN001_012586 [Aquatica leii]|uniref:Disks large-associated protein 5 n=1 Tax=Aquatica leii TaxID=1421715 RepID=A0AAN7SF90_9COLE|nr:hypothetical protein RN001_012586 [Aquatica leii]
MNTRAQFYKSRPDVQNTDAIRKDAEVTRRDSRFSLMAKIRKIQANMSPIDSPLPLKINPSTTKKSIVEDKRFAMLQKYKENKKKQIEKQKARSKPIFKVQHVKHSTTTDYTKIYNEIKGKSINTQKPRLAPSSTYKFKPPANINPIPISGISTRTAVKKKLDFGHKFDLKEISGVSPIKEKKKTAQKVNTTPNKVCDKRFKKGGECVPEIRNGSTSKNETDDTPRRSKRILKTPNANECVGSAKQTELHNETAPVSHSIAYISPFVTLSRGKENARREFHNRRSDYCGSPYSDSRSPQAATIYFSKLLTNETERLKSLCYVWKTYEDEIKPPEEACDMIHTAIGQTELLLKKKFKKFNELINLCGDSNAEQKVTCLDLHGFWDIVYMEVNNLQQRFNYLDKLKVNNWEEILSPAVVNKTKKIKNKPKKPVVKSRIRDLIKEARNKMLEPENHSADVIMTRRLSNISNIPTNDPKSILKSGPTTITKSKSVIFEDCNKENVESPRLSTVNTPRRSSRLTARKNIN